MEQVHEKFKLFRSGANSGNFDKIFKEIEEFANKASRSPKSIGAEYLEASKELILTLGYTEGSAENNNVKLEVFEIGNLDEDNESIEKKIAENASKLKTVICHELFITENNELHMIFMTNI